MALSDDSGHGDRPRPHGSDAEKAASSPDAEKAALSPHASAHGIETSPETSLHRGLKTRHVTMVALGGSLGTGLLIGSGKALAQSGPASLLIAYSFVGIIVYMVLTGIGEMCAWVPLNSGFAGYASRYCHPSLGFTLGWVYLCKYLVVVANQLVSASLVMQFWVPREKLNPAVYVAIFLTGIFIINLAGVAWFGEFEFWLSSVKVLVVIGIIIFSICLAAGAGPNGDAPGFRYWADPGAFAPLYADGGLGKFLGFWSAVGLAVFAFLGVELATVCSAEAQNPRRSVPKAVKLTFYRILIFYVLSIFTVGMLLPYNSKELAFASKSSSTASASPWVVAAKLAGVQVLPHIINASLLIFVLSAANSDIFIGSRTLYGLACDGSAPAIFKRTNSRGVPMGALLVATGFGCLAFLVASDDTRAVFGYFVDLTTIFGLLSWISLLGTYVAFLKARRVQGLTNSMMPYAAPQGLTGTYFALFFCCLIALTKNFGVFIEHDGVKFNWKGFITGYAGIVVYFCLFFGHRFYTKSRQVPPHEVDFYTGKDIIDNEEEAFLEHEAHRRATSTGWDKFYHKYIAWLF